MQVCTLPIRQVGLGSRPWSSAITSRAFSISSAWNKVPETLKSPEHANLEDSTPSSTSAPLRDSERAKDSTLSSNLKVARSSTKSEDPELARQRKKAYMSSYFKTRYAADPAWRDRANLRMAIWSSTQRASNPDWRAQKKEYESLFYSAKLKEDPYFAIRNTLRAWAYNSPLTLDRLSWRNHLPILTDEKVERHCASCGYSPRRGGNRLWWQRRQSLQDGDTLYDCNKCFSKNPEVALPQGFEDVKTVQQLFLRREQLLGIRARLRKYTLPL